MRAADAFCVSSPACNPTGSKVRNLVYVGSIEVAELTKCNGMSPWLTRCRAVHQIPGKGPSQSFAICNAGLLGLCAHQCCNCTCCHSPCLSTDTLQAWLQGAAASQRKVKSDAPPSASSRKVSAVLCVRLCSISLERLCCMPLSQHRGTSAILGRASKARQTELLHGLLYSLQPAKYLSARALWCRQRPRQPSRPFTPLVKRTEAALAV